MRTNAKTRGAPGTARSALILGALGVVFGDIGTSPIYTVETVFNPGDPHPVAVTTDSVFGIVSMILWSVTIIVTVTYVLHVMHADNDGEGGIMALITLIRRRSMGGEHRTKLVLAALGIFGASLFLGDIMITPAISVLSAVEGLKVAEPSLGHLVVPITAAIIVDHAIAPSSSAHASRSSRGLWSPGRPGRAPQTPRGPRARHNSPSGRDDW